MKSHNHNSSDTAPFKAIKIGKTFYSCSTCRARKVKCNGIRPTCNTCLMQDRICNYQENIFTELAKEVDDINKKLNRINAALKKISNNSKAKNLKVSPENIKYFGIYKHLQELFNLKKDLNNEGRNRLRVKNVPKNDNFQENSDIQSLDLDAEIGLLLSKSALEFGYLDVEDDLILKVIEKISKESIISTILSKDYIISRLKDKSLPAYMKFSILAVGSKLFDTHTFFNDHLYMCGSNYAEKAFELLSTNLDQPNLDKIFTALVLAIHYDAISKFSRSYYLVGLARRYAYLLRMNIMDASTNKVVRSKVDWVFMEYKRRMWWFLYVRDVIIGLNYGSVNKISLKDIAVNLPSHDYYFHNYNSDPSLPRPFTTRKVKVRKIGLYR
ncbi:hypothetical protein AYI69_g3713 [Smittium culicis]|uniref:Zn(2)-C6 fungal-type domain-containing protein n=1 Tax=Smittium culicis TaxID=133412 RepID=A0A1R1YJ10_9FUNG|nr:hypothetical protein AYI69_g7347 [Smittium culicis]OMJ26870.1 hypothetical protein AYI69_g3713 [Smittium culicis]